MESNETRLTRSQKTFVVTVLAIVFLGLEATPVLTAVSPASAGRILDFCLFKCVVFLFLCTLAARLWFLSRIGGKSACPFVVLFAIGLYCVQTYFILRILCRAVAML